MYISRSLLASAIVLSFSSLSEASVLRRDPNGDAPRLQRRWSLPSLFGKRQGGVETLQCPDSSFQEMLNANPEDRVQSFCNDWLNIQPTTVVVEYTPTSTSTTSADTTTTVTSITRIYTTETLVVEATTTPAPVVPRMVNAANMAAASEIDAIANEIVQSVIASGTTSAVEAEETTSKNPKRIAAEVGLATACSCKMVDPTSTVTVSFALPAVTTTVGYRRIVVSSETETKTFTLTTTVDATPRSEETPAPTSSGSDTDSASSAEQVSSTAPVTPTVIATTVVTSTLNPSNTVAAVVTAIPFSCPDAGDKHVDQVVGPYRLDYLILCNTEFQSEDRIGGPIPVENETSCAAQCSLINARSGQDTCQGATFTPNPNGRAGGTCSIHGSQGTYVDSPGSVTIVHTGTFANGDECAALNESTATFDTSALVASVTSAGVSISTPGLVTQTSGGGEFHTYVSANSTDANGAVHWSWYQVDASSMNWWAIYKTSWACTVSYTRTIEQAPTTIDGSTITVVGVTTIIGGGETTIISGNETRTITGGSGVATPTFVSASTTGGNGEFTTFFSSATEGSIAASGVIPPSASPTPSAPIVSATSLAGSAGLTLSGESAGASSTGGVGVVSPSSSAPVSSAAAPIQESGSAAVTVSSAASAGSSAGGEGVISPSATGGSAELTLSGSSASANSTGGQGVVSPSVTVTPDVSSTPSASSSSSESEEWDEENSYGRPNKPTRTPSASTTSGNAAVTVSSGLSILSSTGANGIITPTIVTEVTTLSSESSSPAVQNSTALPTQLPSEGSQAVTVQNSTSVASSTGGSGVASPTPSEVVVTVISGVQNLTLSGGTSTFNSVNGNGVIPPPSTVVVTETESLIVVQPSATGASRNFTIAGGTAVIVSTGDFGIFTPTPFTFETTETETETPTPTPESSSPGETLSSTEDLRSGSFTRSRSSTASGPVSVPTANVTTEIPPSATPPPTPLNSTTTLTVLTVLNTTSTSVASSESLSTTDDLRSGSFSRSRTSTASGPVSVPTSNGTTEVPPSVTSPPTPLNSTTTVTVLTVLNTTSSTLIESLSTTDDLRSGSYSRSRSSTASGSASVPTYNATTVVPPSATPPPATLNSTTTLTVLTVLNTTSSTLVESLSTTDDLRSGSFSRPRTSTATAPLSVPTSNGTTVVPPSATPPPATLNSTTTIAVLTVLNTTSSTLIESLSTTDDLRSGTFSRSRSSTASGSLPVPTSNSTTEVPPQTTVVVTVLSTLSEATPFVNTTAPATVSTGIPPASANTTVPATVSSGFPPTSANSTSFLPTGTGFTAQGFTVTVIVNSTLSLPLPTTNLTLIPPVTTVYPTNTTVLPPSPTGNTSFPVLSSSVSLVSVNYSTVSSFSVGNISTILPPTPITSSAVLPTGNQTVPSATPSASLNSTVPLFPTGNSTTLINSTISEACPTATEFSVRTRVAIITTTIIETIPIGPSTCITNDAALPTGNFTFPTGTGLPTFVLPTVDLPTPVLPTSEADLPTPTAEPISLFRRADTPATPAQIEAVCAGTGNVVVQPELVINPDDSTPGWTTNNTDLTINVLSVTTPDFDGQIARFRSAYPGRSLTLTQPLILCPGRRYEISALARQLSKQSSCNVALTVGSDTVVSKKPETDWLEQSGFFTAGSGPSDASVLLYVTVNCAGQFGAPVGADRDGFMVAEVGNVTVAATVGK